MLMAFEGSKIVVTTAHRLHWTRSRSSQMLEVGVLLGRCSAANRRGTSEGSARTASPLKS